MSPAVAGAVSISDGRVTKTRRLCLCACSSPTCQTVVFPMPAGPSRISVVGAPSARNARQASSSCARPTITGRVALLKAWGFPRCAMGTADLTVATTPNATGGAP